LDEELVEDSSSVTEYGGSMEGGGSHPFSYTEQFDEVFPWYLSIGMTPSQFWDQDSLLAKAYRRAERYREDRFNREAHLQGLYVYEAICDASPILHAFAEKGTKAHPYPEKPYELSYVDEEGNSVDEEKKSKSPDQIKMERDKNKMEALMISFNRAFKEKKEKEDKANG
jgi:hypothetical protein